MSQCQLPAQKSSKEEILKRLKDMKANDIKWEDGRCFCLVYQGHTELYEVMKEAYGLYISENALNPAAFPSLKNMENEVVSMTKNLLGGTKQSCGNMTSGGSESILMAVKSAREWAKVHKPEIKEPEIIAPSSVHPACNKACHYFGIKLITVEVDHQTFEVSAQEMAKHMNENTIQLFASTPSYPQGVIDPVSEIAQLAQKHGILCHVDACIGGIVLAFYRKLGVKLPPFDLSVPGVTSLSVDLHKYGHAAKGASVILYNSRELRKHQFFCTTNWSGGIYISPSILGTRPGGAIAAAWAVLNYLGEEGYKEIFTIVRSTTLKLQNGINQIEGLKVLGNPQASILSIASDDCDIYELADLMGQKGWHFDRNTTPASLHLTVMYAHHRVSDQFLMDLKQCHQKAKSQNTKISQVKKNFIHSMVRILPNKIIQQVAGGQAKKGASSSGSDQKTAGIYGLMGTLEQKGALKDVAVNLLDNLYDN